MSFEIRRLSDVLGAEIAGLDLSVPLSKDDFDRIRAAWLEHQVLVFADQHLTEEQHIAFSRQIGSRLEVHFNASSLHPKHPQIYVLSNIIEKDRPVGKGSTPYWHSDLSYMDVPAKASILYGREVPAVGGDTLYSNMYAAYDGLSADIKKLLKDKTAVHNVSDFPVRYARLTGTVDPLKKINANLDALLSIPDVVHPIVIRHPETNRPALFVNQGFTTRILGMAEKEGKELLEFLFAHSVKPEYTFAKKWRQFDLTMWDNRCVIHSATGGYQAPMRRLMHRTTVGGDGRLAAA